MAWIRACRAQAHKDTRILCQDSKKRSNSKDGAGARLGSRGWSFGEEWALTCKAVEIRWKCGSERLHSPDLRCRRYHAALGYGRPRRVHLAAGAGGTHRSRTGVHHHCAAAGVAGSKRDAGECRGSGPKGHNRQHQDRAFSPHGHSVSRTLRHSIF
jgi:hypothetical protein